MTDKEKIRAEVYRRFIEAGKHDGVIAETREDEQSSLLSFIDSHQARPASKFDAAIQDGDDVRYNEDLGCRVNLSQLHRVAQRDRLNQFYNEFDEIIKPYKNSHNYKNLCISLVAWKQNFWRWLLWKAEKVSGELTQSVTKTSDQEMPVSDDLEKEIDRWSKEQCYNKSEKPAFAAVARHFAKWQKQQVMKTAKLSGWVARDKNGNLHLFEMEPTRLIHRWWDRDYHSTGLDESDFPDLKWEDEPVYVKLPIIEEDKVCF